ncbi:MAG TPA: energy transducer TonB [Gemmatimonadaceae bacterium]|jgi:TonB family protein|nr:energy transducer TonB [Gemmatimonadaceae bacterium]
MMRPLAVLVLLSMVGAACTGTEAPPRASRYRDPGPRPDAMPVLLNSALPFRYPAVLYARKAQGNVTLSLFIDRDGRVLADSSRVEETSGFADLDSAALRGSRELRFVPAKLRGDAIPISILFPVYFRHPEAAPLPGDTVARSSARGDGGDETDV